MRDLMSGLLCGFVVGLLAVMGLLILAFLVGELCQFPALLSCTRFGR
ncbi:hypothetical protein [Paracoccus yeei]|nr:hypothetical protein [Paracoccus yeei]